MLTLSVALRSAAGLLGCAAIIAAQVRIEHLDAPLFMLFFWCLICSRYLGTFAALTVIFASTFWSNYLFLAPSHAFHVGGTAGLISSIYFTMALLSLFLVRSILGYADAQKQLLVRQQQTAEKNAAAAIALSDAVIARDNFVAIAGHELKTPLTALYMHTQVWQRRAAMHAQNITGDKLQKSWEKQLHSVERIVRLVEQLLDVSRIDGAPMAFDAECFAVKGVLVDLVQRFGDMAKKAGCSLMLHGNPEAVVVWDRDRFDQIMSNLLSNAIKYAPHAPIHLEWTQGPDALSVSVRDHGPGIAAQDQERVFCRYERLNSSSRSSQGLGLGLWISRKIVESAGGSLRLDSQPERGSTFSLTLPQHQSADIAVTSAA